MNSDWISQLAPERAPAPPPWWPPAIGWWLVAALILMLLGATIAWVKFSRRGPRRRVQAAALAELARIRSLDEASQPRALQRLMRRYALTVFGAQDVAPLSGEAWLRFIETHGGEAFAGTSGRQFLAAAYGKDAAQPEWVRAAEAFIRRARPVRASPKQPPPKRAPPKQTWLRRLWLGRSGRGAEVS